MSEKQTSEGSAPSGSGRSGVDAATCGGNRAPCELTPAGREPRDAVESDATFNFNRGGWCNAQPSEDEREMERGPYCTRRFGHDGDHAAAGNGGRLILARWTASRAPCNPADAPAPNGPGLLKPEASAPAATSEATPPEPDAEARMRLGLQNAEAIGFPVRSLTFLPSTVREVLVTLDGLRAALALSEERRRQDRAVIIEHTRATERVKAAFPSLLPDWDDHLDDRLWEVACSTVMRSEERREAAERERDASMRESARLISAAEQRAEEAEGEIGRLHGVVEDAHARVDAVGRRAAAAEARCAELELERAAGSPDLHNELDRALAERNAAREALRGVVENETVCEQRRERSMAVKTCREEYPDDRGCWCGFCVASDFLARGEKP